MSLPVIPFPPFELSLSIKATSTFNMAKEYLCDCQRHCKGVLTKVFWGAFHWHEKFCKSEGTATVRATRRSWHYTESSTTPISPDTPDGQQHEQLQPEKDSLASGGLFQTTPDKINDDFGYFLPSERTTPTPEPATPSTVPSATTGSGHYHTTIDEEDDETDEGHCV
ncbi:hypothetical protein SERLADRAFT_436389 [Serpula lacrymans var. lacrymans S7.9]|uniref:Uncharacterized protein n=1 Tax=Serpula lacrymans var. lacrymans (strain S7.9) TaxID=578457 RepID=F8NQB8_SERL9|nr:uncharacterized protein SERLADRAFT_436389 [Serpula lacrymans var. lacrymans S7.9]EGO26578.1 hypothetical protein SERLADRAFT_436389 [Serpula lacrymans var. lacrymans S7.9]